MLRAGGAGWAQLTPWGGLGVPSSTAAEPSLHLLSLFPPAVTQLQTSVQKQIVCTVHEGTVLWFLIRHDEMPQFLLRCPHASICSLCPWERSAEDADDSSWSWGTHGNKNLARTRVGRSGRRPGSQRGCCASPHQDPLGRDSWGGFVHWEHVHVGDEQRQRWIGCLSWGQSFWLLFLCLIK